MPAWLSSILAFIVVIGILVAIHEYGHFWVARRMGIRVLRYAIGFGPKVWGRKSAKTGIEYWLCALPLGGYVKMLDEREAPVPEQQKHLAFNNQSPLKRIAVVAAGPGVNLIFVVLAYWLVFVMGVGGIKPIIDAPIDNSLAAQTTLQRGDEILKINHQPIQTWQDLNFEIIEQALGSQKVPLSVRQPKGETKQVWLDLSNAPHDPEQLFQHLGLVPYQPPATPILAKILTHSPAHNAGLQKQDKILAINGQPVKTPQEFVAWIKNHPKTQAQLRIERKGDEVIVPITLGENETGEGRLGAAITVDSSAWDALQTTKRYSPLAALPAAATHTWNMALLTVRMMWQMVAGDVSWKNISGPVQIANYAGQSASIGLTAFISFMAVVSLSLGILNLLPIPVLDGGHLLYYVIELIRGKPLSETMQMKGQQAGLVALMLLMGLAFYNDIMHLLG